MDLLLQINDQVIKDAELLPLLSQYQLLPQLAREIIIDRAIGKIECTPEEVQAARQQFLEQNRLTNQQELDAWCQQQGVQPQYLEKITLRRLRLEKFKLQTWENQVEPYFLKRKKYLDQVVYSLFRTRSMAAAQELYFRIQEKEMSFAEVARKFSEGPEAQTGGLIGPVELSVPHPKIAELLYRSQPGQLIAPTRISDWFVVIRLEQFIRAQLDKSTKIKLLDELFQQWLAEETKSQVRFFSSAEVSPQELEN